MHRKRSARRKSGRGASKFRSGKDLHRQLNTIDYPIYRNDEAGRQGAKRLLRAAQLRIGKLEGERYSVMWKYLTSQWSNYDANEMDRMWLVVNDFLAKLKVVFPALNLDTSGGGLYAEKLHIIFMEVKRQLGEEA